MEYTCMLSRFSHVQLFVTPWTVAHQVPLSPEWVAICEVSKITGFKVVFTRNGHKVAGFLHAQIWFFWQREPS